MEEEDIVFEPLGIYFNPIECLLKRGFNLRLTKENPIMWIKIYMN